MNLTSNLCNLSDVYLRPETYIIYHWFLRSVAWHAYMHTINQIKLQYVNCRLNYIVLVLPDQSTILFDVKVRKFSKLQIDLDMTTYSIFSKRIFELKNLYLLTLFGLGLSDENLLTLVLCRVIYTEFNCTYTLLKQMSGDHTIRVDHRKKKFISNRVGKFVKLRDYWV